MRPKVVDTVARNHARVLAWEEHARRPQGKRCPGLMWVLKTTDDGILAYCVICRSDETYIHNWQETEWARGMMAPVPMEASASPLH